MYRFVFAILIGLGIPLVAACGESVEPGTDTEPTTQGTLQGKGDTLGPLHFSERVRDGVCDAQLSSADPDCFIRIASWNIQDFSVAKADEPEVIDQIGTVLNHFDVVAIQEISNIRERHDEGCDRNEVCPDHPACGTLRSALEEHLNGRLGREYAFAFSDQTRHERYLYVYDTERVELVHDELMDDPEDSLPICDHRPESIGEMARQPHLGVFRAGDFSFALLNVHTSPEDNLRELDALRDYAVEATEMGASDVIVLGDLNADCEYLSDDDIALRGDGYLWMFYRENTTLNGKPCNYDQMIITGQTLEDITGDLGVYTAIGPDVSDHFPIWAHFYVGQDTDAHTGRFR